MNVGDKVIMPDEAVCRHWCVDEKYAGTVATIIRLEFSTAIVECIDGLYWMMGKDQIRPVSRKKPAKSVGHSEILL